MLSTLSPQTMRYFENTKPTPWALYPGMSIVCTPILVLPVITFLPLLR